MHTNNAVPMVQTWISMQHTIYAAYNISSIAHGTSSIAHGSSSIAHGTNMRQYTAYNISRSKMAVNSSVSYELSAAYIIVKL